MKVYIKVKARFTGFGLTSKPGYGVVFSMQSSTITTHASGAAVAGNSNANVYTVKHSSTCQPFMLAPAPAPAPLTLQVREALTHLNMAYTVRMG